METDPVVTDDVWSETAISPAAAANVFSIIEEDQYKAEAVTYTDIKDAEDKLANWIVYTPCEKAEISDSLGMELYLKMDFLQKTGSFKDRGARYVLSFVNKKNCKGIVTASLGNSAKAFAFYGRKFGIPITVVLPKSTGLMKIAQCRKYNAKIQVQGEDINEANEIASMLAKTSGMFYVNGFDNTKILAAQGTLGLEILSQLPTVDVIVVPVGGGGLLAGIAVAIKTQNPNIGIIGVETESSCSFTKSLQEGRRVTVAIAATMADSLKSSTVGRNAFISSHHLVDKIVTVSEKWIALAVLRLVEMEKCLVEPAAATTLAAVLSVLTGANIDTSMVGKVLDRGLVADGRLIEFQVELDEYPGAIGDLCQLITSNGACIRNIWQNTTNVTGSVLSVQINCVCETRDDAHAKELETLIKEHFTDCHFPQAETEI